MQAQITDEITNAKEQVHYFTFIIYCSRNLLFHRLMASQHHFLGASENLVTLTHIQVKNEDSGKKVKVFLEQPLAISIAAATQCFHQLGEISKNEEQYVSLFRHAFQVPIADKLSKTFNIGYSGDSLKIVFKGFWSDGNEWKSGATWRFRSFSASQQQEARRLIELMKENSNEGIEARNHFVKTFCEIKEELAMKAAKADPIFPDPRKRKFSPPGTLNTFTTYSEAAQSLETEERRKEDKAEATRRSKFQSEKRLRTQVPTFTDQLNPIDVDGLEETQAAHFANPGSTYTRPTAVRPTPRRISVRQSQQRRENQQNDLRSLSNPSPVPSSLNTPMYGNLYGLPAYDHTSMAQSPVVINNYNMLSNPYPTMGASPYAPQYPVPAQPFYQQQSNAPYPIANLSWNAPMTNFTAPPPMVPQAHNGLLQTHFNSFRQGSINRSPPTDRFISTFPASGITSSTNSQSSAVTKVVKSSPKLKRSPPGTITGEEGKQEYIAPSRTPSPENILQDLEDLLRMDSKALEQFFADLS